MYPSASCRTEAVSDCQRRTKFNPSVKQKKKKAKKEGDRDTLVCLRRLLHVTLTVFLLVQQRSGK